MLHAGSSRIKIASSILCPWADPKVPPRTLRRRCYSTATVSKRITVLGPRTGLGDSTARCKVVTAASMTPEILVCLASKNSVGSPSAVRRRRSKGVRQHIARYPGVTDYLGPYVGFEWGGFAAIYNNVRHQWTFAYYSKARCVLNNLSIRC
jgi:hypothetical protein